MKSTSCTTAMEVGEDEARTGLRGPWRMLYASDPSSIATGMLPNPVEPDDLRRWVDMIADSGVDVFQQDVYTQGFTVYWRSDRFQYDQREQHKRFLPMLDAGIQPLQVLLDHSRKRGMAFLAGIRMNDSHDRPAYADFVESHPEWQLPKSPRGKPLDFTFDQVREFVFEAMREVVSHFDVDGLEMTFRDALYFPFSEGRDRAHLMTRLVRRVRGMLDERGQSKGRRILLGARVPDSLEECLDKGFDVATWITEGLIDYVSPSGTMHTDYNAPYEAFGALTRKSRCMLYPGLHPWTNTDMYWEWKKMNSLVVTPSNCRALAQTFYGAGADGISVYNHFCGLLWWPPFYPQTLQAFHELRDPQRVALGDRHYVFHPSTEPVKAQRLVLDRRATKPSVVYPLRLYEQMDRVHGATLMLRGSLTAHDELDVRLNGVSMAPGLLGRPDARALSQFPEVRWFPVPSAAMAYGENQLSITLTSDYPLISREIVIDDVQVWVQPK